MAKVKERISNLNISYTILFIFISLFMTVQFFVFNKTMIWEVDGYLQWYAILGKFRNLLMDFIHGNGLALWQWDTGLGSDLISNYSLVLFDPFSYFTLFFSKANIDVAYSIIVVLKLYTVGLVVLGYLKYKNKSKYYCLVGALSYAFCSWGLICLRHDFFISQLILFPLIIWGIDKVWNKENPLMLIVAIFFSATISLYFTYMTAIIVVLYLVVKYFKEKTEKTFKYFISTAVRLALAAGAGGLLAAPVIGAMLYALTNTSTESGTSLSIFPKLLNIVKFVPGLAGHLDINSNYSFVSIGAVMIVALPIIFLCKKKTTAMVMSIISVVIVFFPILQSILNGMSYPAGRWCYAMVFFCVIASMDALEVWELNTLKYTKKIIWFIALVGCFTVVAAGVSGQLGMNSVAAIVINIACALAIVCVIEHKKDDKQKKIKWIVVVNLALVVFTVFNPFMGGEISIYLDRGECFKGYESSSLRYASKIEDKEFYRVNTYWNPWTKGENGPVVHTAVNSNIYWGVPSTFEYLSTLDSDWIKYNVELANSGGNFRRMTSLNNDSRVRLDYLQGVKYYISSNETAEEKKVDEYNYDSYVDYGYSKIDNKYGIFKSDLKSSLGYVFDKYIAYEDYMKYSPLEREQILMDYVVVDDNDADKIIKEVNTEKDIKENCLEENKIVPYELKEYSDFVVLEDNKLFIQDQGAHIYLQPKQKIKNSEVYVVLKGFKRRPYSFDGVLKHLDKKGEYVNRFDKYSMMLNRLNEEEKGEFVVYLSKKNEDGKKILKGVLNAQDENQGVQGVEDYIVNLGYVKDWDGEIAFTFNKDGKYSYDDIQLVAVPTKKFEDNAKKLSDNRLVTTSVANDEIKGYIDADNDGMLYLSIIKNDGWDIYVDGKKCKDVYQVDTAFSGVKVSKGHHDIKLSYHLVWHPYTLIASVLGIILTMVLVVRSILLKKRVNK